MRDLIRILEPTLLFGFDQPMEDPRDGLTLFGPLDCGKPYGIRAGVIGTSSGIQRFRRWVSALQGPISNVPPRLARPSFPGFEAVFGIPWNPEPTIELTVPEDEIDAAVYLDDRHQRVYRTVEVFTSRIIRAITEEEAAVDIWFVVEPDIVYQNCRPKSIVEPAKRIQASSRLSAGYARKLQL